MEESNIIATLGQIAGIGGLALGILLTIFRDVIGKNIFPNLEQFQAYRLIRLIIILTFIVALAGLLAWVYVQQKTGVNQPKVEFLKISAEPAVMDYLNLVDKGNYDMAWNSMGSLAKSRLDKSIMEKSIRNVRVPLGKVIERKIVNQITAEQAPDGTPGAFLSFILSTDFENGRFVESITVTTESNNWKVVGYFINPCKPPFCNVKEEV